MKKFVSILFVGLIFMVLAASCGSSKVRCDAYGNLDNSIEQENLAVQD